MNLKKLTCIILLPLFFAACKKHDDCGNGPIDAEYFVFGQTGGFCGDCYHYYKIQNGQIYQDSLHFGGLVFKANPMGASEYQLAVPLQTGFPNYLKSNPNTNYGCGGCNDQIVYYLEIKNGNDTTRWRIDDITSVQPAAIQPYVQQMRSVLDQLQ